MKNYLMVALILCAIPAVAVGQTVSCDDCSHVASVYMGEGGVIATADDADMVTWVATCSGVTRTGELPANDDGVVSALWTGDLACMAEMGGSFEIGPVMDGGWFWVTDADNSAVGGLVSKDVLMNDTTDITDAGEGISMMMGKGAVHLKEASTGRVGILPNILPEPPAPAAVVCGPRIPAGGKTYTTQIQSSCMLGNGGTKIRVLGTDHLGRPGQITTGMVTRPVSGSVTISADLWLNETGSYSTDTSGANGAASAAGVQLGWVGKAGATGTNWLAATWAATVGAIGAPAPPTEADHGVVVSDGGGSTPAGQSTITITPNASYCPASATATRHNLVVTLTATPGTNAVYPLVATAGPFAAGPSTKITVVCPSASSANMGTELVPENPFPTDE